jgi:hypothetical protein
MNNIVVTYFELSDDVDEYSAVEHWVAVDGRHHVLDLLERQALHRHKHHLK